MNLNDTIEQYFRAVKSYRASRKIIRDNILIVAKIEELENSLTQQEKKRGYIHKKICLDFGDSGRAFFKARAEYNDRIIELRILRPIIRLIQYIRHDRLNDYEKKILMDFLSNPRDMNVPNRLIGLSIVSVKLLTEVFCRQLYFK